VQGMRENGLIPSAPVLIKKYDQNSYLLSTWAIKQRIVILENQIIEK
jgi:hypothetical protein